MVYLRFGKESDAKELVCINKMFVSACARRAAKY